MTVYERIRFLREQLGMSQQELADKLGYKGKSAICKVERGIRDINQSLLADYAKALNTTPAYLMGWEDEQTQNAPTQIELSEDEKTVLAFFRQIPESKQKQFVEMTRLFANSLNKD